MSLKQRQYETKNILENIYVLAQAFPNYDRSHYYQFPEAADTPSPPPLCSLHWKPEDISDAT